MSFIEAEVMCNYTPILQRAQLHCFSQMAWTILLVM